MYGCPGRECRKNTYPEWYKGAFHSCGNIHGWFAQCHDAILNSFACVFDVSRGIYTLVALLLRYLYLDQSQTYCGECACCGRSSEVLFVKEDHRLHTLCQSCREARIKWGDSINRLLTVAEAASIMNQLVMNGSGFSSIEELLTVAKARNLI